MTNVEQAKAEITAEIKAIQAELGCSYRQALTAWVLANS